MNSNETTTTYQLQWKTWVRFGRQLREVILTDEFATKAEADKAWSYKPNATNQFMGITEITK
jgi:hypothetical protein